MEHGNDPRSSDDGSRLSQPARDALAAVADAMIPGGEGYPPASETTAVEFVDRRARTDDLALLEDLLSGLDAGWDRDRVSSWIRDLERSDPGAFALLRSYLYHGYYVSKRLLAALAAKGMDYRGAPQPHGFKLDREPPRPARATGSFVSTEEVRRAVP